MKISETMIWSMRKAAPFMTRSFWSSRILRTASSCAKKRKSLEERVNLAALRQVPRATRFEEPWNSTLQAPPPKNEENGFGNVSKGETANRFSFRRADCRYASLIALRCVTSSFVWGSWNAQQKPSSVSTRNSRSIAKSTLRNRRKMSEAGGAVMDTGVKLQL